MRVDLKLYLMNKLQLAGGWGTIYMEKLSLWKLLDKNVTILWLSLFSTRHGISYLELYKVLQAQLDKIYSSVSCL